MIGRDRFQERPPAWIYPLRAITTFALVCVGWVFFRAATFADSRFILGQMFVRAGHNMIPTCITSMVVVSLVIALAEERLNFVDRLPRVPDWADAAAVTLLLLGEELIRRQVKHIPILK